MARWNRRLSSMMSASSRTLRVMTSRIGLLAGGHLGHGAGRAPARAGHTRPKREVDLGAHLGEALRILAVALRELVADDRRKLVRLAAGLLVEHQALRWLL